LTRYTHNYTLYLMSKTKESNLYNLIKTTIKNAHLTRIESYTLNGIPDLHCAYKGRTFWIELKTNNIKNCNLSKYQINWILKYQRYGGLVFILNKTIKQGHLKLYTLSPCAVLREELATQPNAKGIVEVFEYISKNYCNH
jgi:penicillin-binding protein-related factor A (putative recombinase)